MRHPRLNPIKLKNPVKLQQRRTCNKLGSCLIRKNRHVFQTRKLIILNLQKIFCWLYRIMSRLKHKHTHTHTHTHTRTLSLSHPHTHFSCKFLTTYKMCSLRNPNFKRPDLKAQLYNYRISQMFKIYFLRHCESSNTTKIFKVSQTYT